MFDVCRQCGSWNPEKRIDPAGPFAVCPECGFAHPFRQMPLLLLTGASGTGKTSVCCGLPFVMNEIVALESDLLWGLIPTDPDGGYGTYRNLWLRICKNVSQAGKPVLLCGSGVPDQYPFLAERRYFTRFHFLALTLRDDVLEKRLKTRPEWRRSDEAFLADQLRFNRWFIDHGIVLHAKEAYQTGASCSDGKRRVIGKRSSVIPLPIEPMFLTLDTSEAPLDQTIAEVARWIQAVLVSENT